MRQLLISHNLKSLWQEGLSELLAQPGAAGTILLATPEQKRVLKEYLIKTHGGLVGWHLLTQAEAQRRVAKIGRWELSVIGKTLTHERYWPTVELWAADVMRWVQAGGAPEEIPMERFGRELTLRVMKKVRDRGELLTAQVPLSAQLAIGFDPLETWGIEAVVWALVVEAATPSPAQMMQINRLEASHGPAHWCDSALGKAPEVVTINAPEELVPALAQAYTRRPDVTRVVCHGPQAHTACRLWIGRGASSPEPAWSVAEMLSAYQALQARPAAFSTRLQFARRRVAAGQMKPETLLEEEKRIAKNWEEQGRLEGLSQEEYLLPPRAPLEQLIQKTEKALGPVVQELAQRLQSIVTLLPVEDFPAPLWTELLSPTKISRRELSGVSRVDFEQARGLVDDETLLVWTPAARASEETLLDRKRVQELNTAYAQEAKPSHGYLQVDEHALYLARKTYALEGVPQLILAETESVADRFLEVRPAPYPGVHLKQAARHDLSQPFGANDYALPAPIRASCKQWETVLVAPELAWYQLLRLSPLWQPHQGSPLALWVGNGVHAALKHSAQPAQIDAYFVSQPTANMDLLALEARAQAWATARQFADALQQAAAQTLQVEVSVKGFLKINSAEIPLSGRIDRLVELPDGTALIVDFKTSSSAETLTEKRLEQGDGLQLWLYGRLWQTQAPLALCRLPPGKPLKPQLVMTPQPHPAEEQIAKIYQTGVLGQRAWVWGRFGAEERLPLAALPMDWRAMEERRKKGCP